MRTAWDKVQKSLPPRTRGMQAAGDPPSIIKATALDADVPRTGRAAESAVEAIRSAVGGPLKTFAVWREHESQDVAARRVRPKRIRATSFREAAVIVASQMPAGTHVLIVTPVPAGSAVTFPRAVHALTMVVEKEPADGHAVLADADGRGAHVYCVGCINEALVAAARMALERLEPFTRMRAPDMVEECDALRAALKLAEGEK